MIRIENLCKSFGDLQVLRGVSCDLTESKLCGLFGPSGSGKSVLLKLIGNVLEADSGNLECHCARRDDIGLMFQEGALFDSLNVFDNVAFPLTDGKVPTFLLGKSKQNEVHEKVDAILARVGLTEAAAKTPDQLSGGMRRRVSLARALVGRPRLVLLDDPTCGLDPIASSVIMELIVELHHEYNPTTIIVSQDLRRLLPVVDYLMALFHGRIIFNGTLNDLTQSTCKELTDFVSCRFDLSTGDHLTAAV